ncbi:MAG: hypothetical protein KC486_35410 [Myxococcales bacterium]|nr:hypothetical protein [Myxococcales bacterium]
MTTASILLIPTGEFLSLYAWWLVGALFVGGLMIMLTIRLRVLGPGEE